MNYRTAEEIQAYEEFLGGETLRKKKRDELLEYMRTLPLGQRATLAAERYDEFGMLYDDLCRKLEMGSSTLGRARGLYRRRPDLFKEVKAGRMLVETAYQVMKKKLAGPEVRQSYSYAPGTPMHSRVAGKAKREVIKVVSEISGICYGIENKLPVAALATAMTREEITYWARKADEAGKILRTFARKLRREQHGSTRAIEAEDERPDEGGDGGDVREGSGDPSDRPAGLESGVSQAAD